MAWKTEDSPEVRSDLRALFGHLFRSHHRAFSRDTRTARNLAADRVQIVSKARYRIATAPHRGTVHRVLDREYRHVTIDGAVYWFTLDIEARIVRIEGIFYGGQDHLGRMLARLTAESGETG